MVVIGHRLTVVSLPAVCISNSGRTRVVVLLTGLVWSSHPLAASYVRAYANPSARQQHRQRQEIRRAPPPTLRAREEKGGKYVSKLII